MKNLKRFLTLCLVLALTLSSLGTTAYAASNAYYPRYTGSSGSIVTALKAVGASADSSFSRRAKIAAANGIASESAYRGTAKENISMLTMLKSGQLKRPGSSAPAATLAPVQGGSASSLASANLSRVSFIRQGYLNCKATAAAMMFNLVAGADSFSINDMISYSYNCANLQGRRVQGSDGKTYQVAAYKYDTYKGSRSELIGRIEGSLAQGLPIVAAVHSTRYSAPHHWILIVGKQGADYLALDPYFKGSGRASGNVRSMSALGYDFGITDIRNGPGYGYISLQRAS